MKILILTRKGKLSDDYAFLDAYYWYAKELMLYLSARGHHLAISSLRPNEIDFSQHDLVISYFYPYILRKQHLATSRFVNCHPSFLPYNRGASPNVWSIVDEDSICGVSIHKVDEGVDTGNLLAQRTVKVFPMDTGESLYHRLELACIELWYQYWPFLESLLNGTGDLPPGVPQDNTKATAHKKADVAAIDDLELTFGKELAHRFINVLRARTFYPYQGAYLRDANGKKVYVRIELEDEDGGA